MSTLRYDKPVMSVSLDLSATDVSSAVTEISLTQLRIMKRLSKIVEQLSYCSPVMQSVLYDLGEEMLRLGAGLTEIEYRFELINQVLGDEKK